MNTNTGTVSGFDYTIETPEELIFAYSKHVYFRLNLSRSGSPIINQEIRLLLIENNGNFMFDDYRYTGSDGSVVFDVARVLQIAMKGRQEELSSIVYYPDISSLWNIKTFKISLIINGGISITMPSIFTDYRVALGAHDNINDWNRVPVRLKCWSEYPFTFDFPDVNKINVSQNGSTYRPFTNIKVGDETLQFVRHTIDRFVGRSSRLWVRTNEGFGMAGDKLLQGNNIVILDIDNCPRIASKTYLRWIGEHGEVFYWLFDNVTENMQVNSSLRYNALTDDLFRGDVTNKTRGNGIIRDTSVTNTRALTTDYLDSDYYNLVRSVASSPCVDMFVDDGSNGKWQRVNVSDITLSRSLKTSNKAKKHRVELTIEIPEI